MSDTPEDPAAGPPPPKPGDEFPSMPAGKWVTIRQVASVEERKPFRNRWYVVDTKGVKWTLAPRGVGDEYKFSAVKQGW